MGGRGEGREEGEGREAGEIGRECKRGKACASTIKKEGYKGAGGGDKAEGEAHSSPHLSKYIICYIFQVSVFDINRDDPLIFSQRVGEAVVIAWSLHRDESGKGSVVH